MNPDNRSKNTYFSGTDIKTYLQQYAEKLTEVMSAIDVVALEKLHLLIEETRKNRKTIWVMGNGGSLAIAEHLCCDWTKGLQSNRLPHVKVHSLTSGPLMTAIANDLSYAQVFGEQIKMFCEPGDVVMVISSSGNSDNVVQAIEVAKSMKVKTVAMTGFSGGRLKDLADIHLHAAFNNYGIVEDAHQIMMHVLAQFSYLKDK
jgi:D-sedoheptulose 7-phosphate isomerase